MEQQKKIDKETCSRFKWKYDCLDNSSLKKVPPSFKQAEERAARSPRTWENLFEISFWQWVTVLRNLSWRWVCSFCGITDWVLPSFSLWNASVLWEQNSAIYIVNAFFLLKSQVVCFLWWKGLVQLTSWVTSLMTVSPKLLSVQLFSLQAFLEQSWLSSSLLLNTLALW